MTAPQGSLADLRALSDELQAAFEEVLAPGEGIPPSCHKYLARGSRQIAFNKTKNVLDLVLSIRLLGAYQMTDKVVAAGDLLARVPFTGNKTIYSPYLDAFALAARLSSAQGDSATAVRFLDRMNWPDSGTREALLAKESTQRRAAGGLLKFPLDRDPPISRPFMQELNGLLGECLELDFMWGVGGSAEWPPGRIEAEISRNEAHVLRLAADAG